MKNIGDSAFKNCSGFKGSLIIPNSVTYIGNSSFSGCSGFDGALIISEAVTTIGTSAFAGCSGFKGVLTIPNSVEIIESFAFFGCSGFTGTLIISNFVTFIGNSTFCDCSGFTKLQINSFHLFIGDFAFASTSFSIVSYGPELIIDCGVDVFPIDQEFDLPNSYNLSEFCGMKFGKLRKTKKRKMMLVKMGAFTAIIFSIIVAILIIFIKKLDELFNSKGKSYSSYVLIDDYQI